MQGRLYMKKKTLMSITTTAIICSLFAGAIAEEYTKYSSRFIKKFKDCDAYEETVNSTFENKTFKTNRKIIGWRNGFCRYEETITSPEDQYRYHNSPCTKWWLYREDWCQWQLRTDGRDVQYSWRFCNVTAWQEDYRPTGTKTVVANFEDACGK